MPTKRAGEPSQDIPALEEVLIAFQKSLGRARKSAIDFAAQEVGFQVGGMQQVFGINRMSLKLRGVVGVQGEKQDQIGIDFAGSPAGFSEIEFELTAQPVQEVENGVILIKTPGEVGKVMQFRAYAIQNGRTQASVPLKIRGWCGDDLPQELEAKTDAIGQCTILLRQVGEGITLRVEKHSKKIPFKTDDAVYLEVEAVGLGISKPVKIDFGVKKD